MKTRTLILSFTLAPLGCVLLGLTFHYLYLSAAIEQAGEAALQPLLEEQAARAAAELGSGARGNTESGDPGLDSDRTGSALSAAGQRLEALLLPLAKSTVQVQLVDNQWRVLASNGAPVEAADDSADKLNWSRAPKVVPGQPVIGRVRIASGEHLAVAHPIGAGRGYAVIHAPASAIAVDPQAFSTALLPAGGIAMVWTAGLLAVSVYLLVSYFQQQSGDKKHNSPQVDALRQTQALLRTQETVIFGLAKLSDSRDPETGDHLERIAHYSSALAGALRQHPDFREVVTPSYVRLIGLSSALHDIGKVGVEDAILRKPGALTLDERSRMKHHAMIGGECLREIERRLGTSNFLQMAREIACAHHERWDGTGYPHGLAGEEIPLAARIVAIADVYDALASRRVYKEAYSHEECVIQIAEEAGSHFDPRLVDVFVQIEGTFRQIADRYADVAARTSMQTASASGADSAPTASPAENTAASATSLVY